MTGHDPMGDEEARGRDALRELRVEPLPDDVVARLEGRLEGALGRPAPVRRRRRSRLAFAIPGVAVAGVAAVVVAVVVTNGNGGQPAHESASLRAKAASPTAPTASKSYQSAAAGSAGDAAAVVRVPALIGRSLGKAGSLAGAHGLRVQLRAKPCPSSARVQVVHQQPRAGTRVAAGATIHVSTC